MRPTRASLLTLATASLLALGACVVDDGDLAEGGEGDVLDGKADGTGSVDSPIGPAAQAAWRAYVAELGGARLQPGCRPFQSVLPPGVAYHGTVVLFHGFTACPQQFVEVSRLLGRQGMVVLAPLLPGQGRIASRDAQGKLVDDISAMPGDDDFEAYARFADRMGNLLVQARGVHVVGGISVGGAMAARVAEDVPGVDRALLMNSFFDPAGFTALITAPLNAVAAHFRTGWGAGCEAERARGRAGICQFEVTHLRAVQRFGEQTAARAGRIAIRTQNVGVQDDKAASPKAIAAVGDVLGGEADTCFFEPGVSHSLLSRYDNPDQQKFWMTAALAQVTRFVATGGAFDEVPGVTSIGGYPRCRGR